MYTFIIFEYNKKNKKHKRIKIKININLISGFTKFDINTFKYIFEEIFFINIFCHADHYLKMFTYTEKFCRQFIQYLTELYIIKLHEVTLPYIL